MEKKMKVPQMPNLMTLGAMDLIAHIKSQTRDRYRAWDDFIKARSLRPEIDAKDFYQMFDIVSPLSAVKIIEADYAPTHFDEMLKIECMIVHDTAKERYDIMWSNGMVGSDPEAFHDHNRFTRIREAQ